MLSGKLTWLVNTRPARFLKPGGSASQLVITAKDGMFIYQQSPPVVTPFATGNADTQYIASFSKANANCALALTVQNNPLGVALAVGTQLDGIFFFASSGTLLSHINQQAGLPSNGIWNIAMDRYGDLWAATNNGIARIHLGARWTLSQEGRDFQGGVNSIASCGERLYIATLQGLYSLLPGPSPQWQPDEEIKGQCFDLLCCDGDALLVATGGDGLSRLSRERQGRATLMSKYYAYSLCAVEGMPGLMVFGGRDGIVLLSRKGKYAHHSSLHSYKEVLHIKELPEEIRSVKAICRNDTLHIWAGMPTKGVVQIKISLLFTPTVIARSRFSRERSNLVAKSRLLRPAKGVARNDGVNRKEISNYKVEVYDTSSGLPEGEILVSTFQKRILFGAENGLYQFKNGRFIPDCSLDTLFCNGSRGVFHLAEEENGEVWIDNGQGGQIKHLLPLRNTNLYESTNYESVGKYEIDSVAFLGVDIGVIRAIYPQGEVCWLGRDNGVVCYNKNVRWRHDVKYPALIREVTIKTESQTDSVLFGGALFAGEEPPAHLLAYRYNNITFRYSAPFYDGAVEYSYLLEGQDTKWSAWSKERKKEYTNLSEGKYIFLVKAKNIYGHESETAEYPFEIEPPYYKTLWFYLAQVGFYGLLLWLAVALKNKGQAWAIRAAYIISLLIIVLSFEYIQNLAEDKVSGYVALGFELRILLNACVGLLLAPLEYLINRFTQAKDALLIRKIRKDAFADGEAKGRAEERAEVLKKMRENGFPEEGFIIYLFFTTLATG